MEFLSWNADPVLLSFAGFKIHWYGALFALAIIAGFQVMKTCYQKENIDIKTLDNLMTYAVVGIIVGARLGHCFFYDPHYYLNYPAKIFAIWEGGLASHGGGIGVIVACYLYQRKYQIGFLYLLDRLAISTAIFGFFVRTGNFINSEIIGKPSQVPWAVIFERVDHLPRHAVQLYEAIAYFTIFIVLFSTYRFSKIKDYPGALLGLFLIFVFSARFALEFFKVKQAAYSSDLLLSTGQLLSLPFFIAGILLVVLAKRSQARST